MEEEEQEYLLNALEEVATDFEGGSAGTHTLFLSLSLSLSPFLSLSHTPLHPPPPSTTLRSMRGATRRGE